MSYDGSFLSPIAEKDTLYGKIIDDPYRFMEDVTDTTVLKWYKDQSKYAHSILSRIKGRNSVVALQDSFNNNNDVKISYLNITDNDKYFYVKTNHNTNGKLFFRNGFVGEEILLFNPEDYKDGYTINYVQPNWDGTIVVIGMTKNDSEIGEIKIIDVLSKELFTETISNCWPSALGGVRWLDNKRFTYEYIPITDKASKDFLLNIETKQHIVGEDSTKDKVIFSKKNNPEITIKKEEFPEVGPKDKNRKYVFANVSGASYYADYYYSYYEQLNSGKIAWTPLYSRNDLIKRFYVAGDSMVFLTSKDAENFKICKTSIKKTNYQTSQILVKEDPSAVITDFALTSNGLFFVKTKNGVDSKLFKLMGTQIAEIPLPKKAGSINLSSKGSKYPDLWVKITGWTSQSDTYKYEDKNGKFIPHKLYPGAGYKEYLKDIVVEEIEVSNNGVNVPLSIIYKKGTKLDGSSRAFMRAYGAFGYSMEPALNYYLLHWVNQGGIYAEAHVRGGGEKGNEWYLGGYKDTKDNSWNDLIACSEYLIEKKYTAPKKLVISSGSGGGVVIGNAIVERPELFEAAVVRVGVFNTLRSEFGPNGKNLSREFGTVNDSLEFQALLKMDSYNKIKSGTKYPAVYLTAGLNDSRVAVWQPGKFAARLQETSNSGNPTLLSVNFSGGHGFDASTETTENEIADIISFALWQTGHPDFQLE